MALTEETLMRLLMQQRSMLLGFVISLVRDPALAEDILQEVSVTAVRRRDAIEDESVFSAWIRQTARYTALNAVRKQQRRPVIFDDTLLEALEEEWVEVETETPPPEAIDAIRECITKLTPRAQRLVELKYYKGLDGRALAEKIGRQLNTVYVALTRIHRKLSDCVRSRLANEGLSSGY